MTDVTAVKSSRKAQPDDEIDIGFLLGSLWDHKGFIVALTLMLGVAGFVYASLSTPIYQGDALVQVEKKSGTIPGADMSQMLGRQGPDTNTEIEILRSRLILGQVVDQTDLQVVVEPVYLPWVGEWLYRKGVSRPGVFEGKPYVWGGESLSIGSLVANHHSDTVRFFVESLGDGRYRVLDLQEKLLGEGQVGEQLVIELPYFELRVADLSAPKGARFEVTKLSRLSATNQLKNRLTIQSQGRETGILRLVMQGADQQEIVNSLDATTQVFLTQNIARQAAEAKKSLEFLEEQAPKVRQQLTEAENRLNEYRLKSDSIDLSFETQNALTSLVQIEASLNELALQESELARRFTPNHPVYRSLLEKKEQLLREKSRLEERTDDLPETQQQVLRLSRDVQVTQEIYVQLLNRMQELRLARAGTIGNVRILDNAVVQGQVAPRKNLIVAVSALSGLLLAMVTVLLRAAFNRGIVSPEQLEEMDLSVYATVPLSDEEKRSTEGGKKRTFKRRKAKKRDLLAARNPADLSIEAIRSLRTSLHFAMLEAADNRLMITGPSPGIGKSFISANLATVCAQSGQRVVVLDGDMRKGHVHEAFGGSTSNGLSDVLSGQLSFDDSIHDSSVDGLSWVGRGSAPPNPSELLMHKRFSEYLKYLSERFDLVVIDTPPILAVTDAAVIGAQCGTSLMVVRFGQNTPKEVQIAESRLSTGGVALKGAILNAMEKKAATSYGYYGYYNYAYKSD
ncbi:polysaccharide biosynthesis tyrosine autokinase [Marinobacter adhaerens]|uniref:Exopolysaccharide tyrosine-protein kinase n=1 Tax=Marinobacter adhaerens (strain DSM 23420 / HP15) TaxID=225937 RepID=E4PS08_MARAH|nr:polysaccharide biosynthesis tyrosine autokinase [Marinobacter adhaerens]ADQ00043.1 exopolysaccharide tyrosine-protein kinase [Marinobacter adhaerens HP15]MBW4980234.1 polysaccharide biosynthesis tyrosine autokinase [Marinobacter adhaerens]